METGRHRMGRRRLVSLLFSAGFILIAGWVFFNRQMLQDEIVLARYQPPEAIATLAHNASLSERGKDLFYVNLPELHGESSFNKVCQGLGDEQSNVLGCFNGQRIYIFNVTDKNLRGVREVTAAHEMLHAAYMRLGQAEKRRVDSLLQRQLTAHVNPHVNELIEIYNRLEPGQLYNEMHSILATEQEKLSPELEAYYSQYFENRQKVVDYAEAYREVFDSLKNRQKSLTNELDQLASSINAGTDDLNESISAYNARVERFNTEAQSGDMSESEFNSQRARLEAESSSINVAIAENDALRATYDRKRKQYESLAVEFTSLQNSISSRPSRPEDVQ